MRKELMIISLAATICGCGYDNGKTETDVVSDFLPALPQECDTDDSCRVDSALMGECVAGKCQRYCTDSEDCETGTVCESGLCRPIVPCREVIFAPDQSDLEETYKGKKCIQVFSHTPTAAWENLRSSDIVFDRKFVAGNGAANDFTSDNFKFELPKQMVEDGTNFASITLFMLTYLVSLVDGGNTMYDCMKPRIYKPDQFSYVDMPQEAFGNDNSELYQKYTTLKGLFASQGVKNHDVSDYCNTGIVDQYMNIYAKYFEITPDLTSKDGITSESKLKEVWGDADKKVKEIKGKLSIPNELSVESTIRDLLTVVVKEYKYYIQQQCSVFVKKLDLVAALSDIYQVFTLSANNLGREAAEQLQNVIIQDYMYRDFGNGSVLKPIAVCNENYYEAVRGKNKINTNQIQYCNSDVIAKGSTDAMYQETLQMLEGTPNSIDSTTGLYSVRSVPANDLKVACEQSINLAVGSKVKAVLNGSDFNIQQCVLSEDLIEAALGKSLTVNESTAIKTIPEFLTNLASIDINSIIDPSILWIVGESHQNLVVLKSQTEFADNDFIFSQKVALSNKMLNITNGKGFYVSQIDKDDTVVYTQNDISKVNGDNYINFVYNNEKMAACEDGTCNYRFRINPKTDKDFVCGGIAYTLQNVSGFIVLNEEDKIGKRVVETSKAKTDKVETGKNE